MADDDDDGLKKGGDDPLIPLNIKKKPKRLTAVAITDRTAENALPQVTAAGRGNIAEQILALAFANGIKVREDSALAAAAGLVMLLIAMRKLLNSYSTTKLSSQQINSLQHHVTALVEHPEIGLVCSLCFPHIHRFDDRIYVWHLHVTL